MIRDILSCQSSNDTTRIRPTRNENEMRTVPGRLSRSKPIPPLNYSNREQLRNLKQNTT
jgi:hypothetical protein